MANTEVAEILQCDTKEEMFADDDPLWDELSVFRTSSDIAYGFSKRLRESVGDDNCDSTDEKVKNYKVDME